MEAEVEAQWSEIVKEKFLFMILDNYLSSDLHKYIVFKGKEVKISHIRIKN